MSTISVKKAPEAYTVVPFFVTAAIFFFAFSILYSLTGSQIINHYFQPKVLTLVHTLALGWATMIILGAAYQLIPVIFEEHLHQPKLAFLSYLCLMIGTCLLLPCFWFFAIGKIMIVAGCLIVASSLLYFYILYQTIKKAKSSLELHIYFLFSAFWFCFTTIAGLLLVLNLQYSFINKNHLELLKLHAHAGIVGWFLLLVFGAGAKLIPMFILGKSTRTKLLKYAAILLNIGLILFLINGYKNEVTFNSIIFGLIIFSGVLCWLIYIISCFKNRARKKIDIPMRHSTISIICLLLAFASLPFVLSHNHGQWITLYAVFIFLGWLTGIILGMTYKTLPFIIWNIKYTNQNGKPKAPMPKDLYNSTILSIQYYVYIACLLVTSIAVFSSYHWIMMASTVLWIVLAVSYLTNVLIIVFTKK